MTALPPEAYAAALAGLSGMNVTRLGSLLRHCAPPHAWALVRGEVPAAPDIAHVMADGARRAQWARSAAQTDVEALWVRCTELNVAVVPWGDPRYPVALLDDPLPPPVLFVQGDLSLLAGRRVGIVGTRNATAAGRHTAERMGHQLAAAGVHVVSGLARGIDGCAHRGVLAAEATGRPIAVVASGHDVVYPREHGDLWAAVGNCGLLLSEAPPGTRPEAYRFPMRNRIIAGLSEALVVVESRERGGSLLTANDAMARNVPLMAVPGPVGRRIGAGTNQLLCDGAMPVTGADDVLTHLSFHHERLFLEPADLRPRPRPDDVPAYRVLQREPRTLDGVALALGAGLIEAAMALARLEAAGWIAQVDGWFECVGSPLK